MQLNEKTINNLNISVEFLLSATTILIFHGIVNFCAFDWGMDVSKYLSCINVKFLFQGLAAVMAELSSGF